MSLIKLALESLEVDEAIEMINKEDSTDPVDVEQVTSYKEQLELINEKKKEDSDDSSLSSDDQEDGQDPDSSTDDEQSDTSVDSREDNDDASDEGNEEASDDAEDETEDKNDEETEKGTEEIKNTSEDLDKALEHFGLAIEAYNDVVIAMRYKRPQLYNKDKYASKLVELSSTYNMPESSVTALESFSATEGYSSANAGLKTSLEGIKEFLKGIGDKIVAFIKRIIRWIMEYFTYDPAKDREKIHSIRSLKEKTILSERKAREFESFEREATLSLSKKVYRDSSSSIVAGNSNMTYDKAGQAIIDSLRELRTYWKETINFSNNYILKRLDDVTDFEKTNAISLPLNVLNISKEDYAPIKTKIESDKYKNLTNNQMPDTFELFASEHLFCGNKRLIFILPTQPLKDPLGESKYGDGYAVMLVPDYQYGQEKRVINYSSDTKVIQMFFSEMETAFQEKANVNHFMQNVVKRLKKVASDLEKEIATLTTDAVTNQEKKENLSYVRYNVKVLNKVVDQPLFETMRYFIRLSNSAESLATNNIDLLDDVIERIKKRKEELGI